MSRPVVARWPRWTPLAVLLAIVDLPIVIATVRGLARGWLPLSDNGLVVIRSRDVLSSHPPLLGTASSASEVAGEAMNHLGPLLFDLLALPVRLLGPWVGVAVGAMLVNVAACTFVVVVGHRIGGLEAAVPLALCTALLQFVMGSEELYEPWPPTVMILPAVAFLVAVWGLAAGRLALAPWVVGIGALLVQTHLGHLPIVAVMGLAGVAVGAWSATRSGPKAAWKRPLGWSVGVAALCWSQPVIEELGAGRGNLSRVADLASGDAPTVGTEVGIRLAAKALLVHPWFTRESFAESIPLRADPRDPNLFAVEIGPAVAVLAVALLVLVALAVAGARSGRREHALLAALAALALLVVPIVLGVSPVNAVGLTPHQMRWAWSVAAFASAAGLSGLLALAGSGRPRRVAAGARWAIGLAAVGVAVATVPTYEMPLGPTVFAEYEDSARELVRNLDTLQGRGTVLFDPEGGIYLEPYSGFVLAELQDLGVPFVVEEEGLVRQLGEDRRSDGSAIVRLWQEHADRATVVPEGAQRIGYAEDGYGDGVALFVEPIG